MPALPLLLALLMLLPAGALPGAAAEWPQLRGPGHDAHVGDLSLSLPWPESGPPVLWRAAIGQGYSGFVIAGERAYTQAQSPAGQYVVCIDMGNGEIIWKTRYGWPWNLDRAWPGPYATPTLYQGKLYFAGCHGTIGCVDAEDGATVWLFDAKPRYQGQGTDFGYACSPLVEDDRVYLPIGGKDAAVIALDAADGSLVWASGSDAAGYASCYPVTVAGRRQIVSLLESALVAHDPDNGRELWRHQLLDDYNPHPAWPLYEEPYLFAAFAFRRGAIVLRLGYDNHQPHAEQVWADEVISNDIFSSVVSEGYVYGFDIHDPQSHSRGRTKGVFKCVELATGVEQWSTGAVGHAMVLCDGRYLVLFNETGWLIIARATPDGYHELARAQILSGEVSWTMPAIAGNRMLVRNQRQVACVSLGRPDPAAGAAAERVVQQSLAATWVDRYYSDAFWAPALAELLLWYLACVAGVYLPAGLLTLPLYRAAAEDRPGKLMATLFVVLASAIGGAGPAVFTEWAGRLVFTWPSVLFLLLWLAHTQGLAATRGGSAVSARLALLLLAGAGAGCFIACLQLSLLAGWGFLIGLLPALPATHLLARRLLDGTRLWRLLVISWLAFTAYFWLSALCFAFKAGVL
jgi:outer membrane protein assembly factor BamB